MLTCCFLRDIIIEDFRNEKYAESFWRKKENMAEFNGAYSQYISLALLEMKGFLEVFINLDQSIGQNIAGHTAT